ncbi:hypothetical protein X801_07044, partial [Opisthorchis viverrini]
MKKEFASYESHKANNSGSIVSGFLMTAVSWKRPLFGLWFDSVAHEKISGNVGSYLIVETPTINLIRPEGHTSLQGNVKDVPSMTQSGKSLTVMGGAEQMFVFETFFTNVPTLVNFTRAILVESLLCFAISIFVYVAALKAPIECCKMIEPDLKSGCPNQFTRTNSYFFNGCESNLRQYLHEHIPVIVYASLSVLPLDVSVNTRYNIDFSLHDVPKTECRELCSLQE